MVSFLFLLATITTLPLAGWHIFVMGIPIYIPEIFTSLAAFHFFLFKKSSFSHHSLFYTPFFLPLSLLVFGFFTSAYSHGVTLASLGIFKSWFFFPLLFAFLCLQVIHELSTNYSFSPKESLRDTFLLFWFLTLFISSCIALFFLFTHRLTYDGRLGAWYLSPNYLALFLYPGILLGFSFFLESFQKKLWGRVIFFLSASLCVSLALFFTFSYTVLSATLLGFFSVIFLRHHSKHTMRILFFCCFGLLFFLFFSFSPEKFSSILHQDNRSSLASRIMIWKASSLMLAHHPFFGIGAGNFQATYLDYQRYFPPYLEWAVPHPHNLLLSFWLQTGIFGLIGFLWLLFIWFKMNLSKLRMQKKQKIGFCTQALFLGLMITFLLIGLLDTPYWKNDLAYSFWLLFALGL